MWNCDLGNSRVTHDLKLRGYFASTHVQMTRGEEGDLHKSRKPQTLSYQMQIHVNFRHLETVTNRIWVSTDAKHWRAFPKDLEGLTCLKHLWMHDGATLEEFPWWTTTLKALEALSFLGCKILKGIPEGFGGWTWLKKRCVFDCDTLKCQQVTGVGGWLRGVKTTTF